MPKPVTTSSQDTELKKAGQEMTTTRWDIRAPFVVGATLLLVSTINYLCGYAISNGIMPGNSFFNNYWASGLTTGGGVASVILGISRMSDARKNSRISNTPAP